MNQATKNRMTRASQVLSIPVEGLDHRIVDLLFSPSNRTVAYKILALTLPIALAAKSKGLSRDDVLNLIEAVEPKMF